MFRVLLLLLVFPLLAAQESFVRTLDSISYKQQLSNTIAMVKLSDGSLWKWTPDMYSENLLRRWAPGDEIIIRTMNHPGFILQNISKPYHSPKVALNFNSYDIFPRISEKASDSSWLRLSDGSEWKLVFDFSRKMLKHWLEGDHVITVQGFHNDFELINIDVPYEHRRLIDRNLQVSRILPPEEDTLK